MKICPNCQEEVENNFDICWNCNFSFTEKKVVPLPENNTCADIECLRCHVPMLYSGEYKFLEGTRIGVLGDLFELLQNRERFDLYICPKCGKVEFFTPLKREQLSITEGNMHM